VVFIVQNSKLDIPWYTNTMESILQADIFFFITTIFVVILIVISCIIGFYLIKSVRNFSSMSKTLKDAVDDTDGELREIGSHIQQNPFFTFLFGRKKSRESKSKKHTTKS
jgi:hypothetical protein